MRMVMKERICNSPTFQTSSQELRTILFSFVILIFTDLIVKIIRFVLYLLFLDLITILSALLFIYFGHIDLRLMYFIKLLA